MNTYVSNFVRHELGAFTSLPSHLAKHCAALFIKYSFCALKGWITRPKPVEFEVELPNSRFNETDRIQRVGARRNELFMKASCRSTD
jgi:hypothetical protein